MAETAHTGPETARLTEVVDGVYAWVQPDGTWWVNNAGAVAGDDGLLVVDTCATENRTRAFLTALARATGDSPVRWAVNTHQHGDHAYGNSLLPDSAALIGQAAMREALAHDPILDACPPFWSPVPDWGGVTRRLPSIVLDRELTVHTGGRRVDLRHPGLRATPICTLSSHPRTLRTDSERKPNSLMCRRRAGGDPKRLRRQGKTTIFWVGCQPAKQEPAGTVRRSVPTVRQGCGNPCFRGGEDANTASCWTPHEAASPGGSSRWRAPGSCDLGAFGGWADAERIVLNLHRAHADLTGTGMDLVAALADAVEWNGGPLPTSV